MDSILDLLFGGLKKTVDYAQKHPYVVQNLQNTIERSMLERQRKEAMRNTKNTNKKQYCTKVSGHNLATLSAQLGTSKNLSFLEVSSYMK